jgi:AraC family transcriptional regulator of adaptative response/methylated-DNA-[protein]-cysteine methyltransferase
MIQKVIRTISIETPIGEMTACATRDGICLLEFTDKRATGTHFEELSSVFQLKIKHGSNRHLRALRRQLREYFTGKRKVFSLKLVTPGTEFQQRVWNELLKIPFGTTASYLEQAVSVNNPGSVRAVAGANASNRIAIVIPCHRVIGSDGSLVGYGGGLERKKWLIDHERKYSGKPVDGTLF